MPSNRSNSERDKANAIQRHLRHSSLHNNNVKIERDFKV